MTLPLSLKRTLISSFPMGVYRAAAVLPTAALSPQTIFNVEYPFLLTGLFGYVTTACSGTATTLKISLNPDNSAAQDLTSAVAVTSDALGTIWSQPVTVGAALVVSAIGALINPCGQAAATHGILLTPGIVTITTSATNTGQAAWALFGVGAAPRGKVPVRAA